MSNKNKANTPAPAKTPAAQAVQTTQARGAKVKVVRKTTAATPTPAPTATTAASKAPKATGPSRNRSIDTFEGGKRMGIMEYQNHTFAIQESRKLNDEQLAADWQKQFPNAVKFNTGHVAGARRDYNNGRHGKGQVKPAVPVPEYQDGKPLGVLLDQKGAATTRAPKAGKKAEKKIATAA